MKRKPNSFMRRYQYYFILVFLTIIFLACIFFFIYYIPAEASLLYGPPASHLSISDRIEYSSRLLMHGDELSKPLDPNGVEQSFLVEPGESVTSIANRLEGFGLVSNSEIFFDYVVYTGIDTTIQAGDFTLSPAQSIIDIAQSLQKFSPGDASLVILAGWRAEEIAASLSTSGLAIDPATFLSALNSPPQVLDFTSTTTMEGFFYPDVYTLPRETTLPELFDIIGRNFTAHITNEMQNGFTTQGLTIYQAVTLASIVEREAIKIEEAPMIASVYLNRLSINMKLDADPTVQYALGFQTDTNTWWKNPLALEDLQIFSPYNTYQNLGLPPAPISNPSLEALMAVAFPQTSPYYYFRAECDKSGFHVFEISFEEHLENACP